MAKKDKVYIPSGIGGLVRYPEEEKSKIKLEPIHVIIFAILIAVIEIILALI
ncbi:MAG: preprotein translocase subunit Sec61beta [Candidatus Aenigmarchaeota archaeon]|nr:preprotein translocase subunit Sec61beta [Candidatus Aenigmarchaeota archaeon]MDW8149480.1 preprotein translocase subunit Sec61beta [Candidatus Aenigmarchaeota archaeon]